MLWRLTPGQIAGTLSPDDPCRSRPTDFVPAFAVRVETRITFVRHRRHLTPSPQFKPGTFGSRRPFCQTASRYMLGRTKNMNCACISENNGNIISLAYVHKITLSQRFYQHILSNLQLLYMLLPILMERRLETSTGDLLFLEIILESLKKLLPLHY